MSSIAPPGGESTGRPSVAPAPHEQPGGHRQAPPAAPPPAPATGRDRIRGPVGQGLLALGIYLVVWVPTAVRPLVHHVTRSQLNQANPDPNFYVWSLRWWPYATGHGLNPLYSSQLDAPVGHALAWAATVPALGLLAAPLTLAAGPVVAFNLLTAAALPASAWAAFVLCRRLTGQFWAALVAGAVFGFSAYEMNHYGAGQINLSYTLLLPVLAYLILLWRDESIGSRTFVILAGITMAVQFYVFLETFADLSAILVISLAVGCALAGRDRRPEILRLARLTGVAYVIAIVLAAPYIRYALATTPPRPPALTSLDLASLVIPRVGRTFGIGWLTRAAADPHPVSAGGYVGVPLLVLAILLAVTAWSSRLVRFLSCMLVLIVVASLGPELYLEGRPIARLPWAGLYDLPLVRNAYATRLMLFAFLCLAVATALWLAGPAKRGPWARWVLGPLVVAAVALNASAVPVTQHSTVPAFISSGEYQRDLSPGEIVVVVSKVRNAGMLWQAEADFYMRLAGGFLNTGYSHRVDWPVPVQGLVRATPLSVSNFEKFVKADHVGAILLDARHQPRWVGIFSKVGLVGHATGNVIVYPTDDCRSCRVLDEAQLRAKPLPSP